MLREYHMQALWILDTSDGWGEWEGQKLMNQLKASQSKPINVMVIAVIWHLFNSRPIKNLVNNHFMYFQEFQKRESETVQILVHPKMLWLFFLMKAAISTSNCRRWWKVKSQPGLEPRASGVPCQRSTHWAIETRYFDWLSHTWIPGDKIIWKMDMKGATMLSYSLIYSVIKIRYAYTGKN